MGEISEFQLRRHGRLSQELCRCDPRQVARLDQEVALLVEVTRRFYERLLRLDRNWRLNGPAASSAVERLRQRIEERLAG